MVLESPYEVYRIASFPASPRAEHTPGDGKLDGAWERGYKCV